MIPYREGQRIQSTSDVQINIEAIKLEYFETIGNKVQSLIKASIQEL